MRVTRVQFVATRQPAVRALRLLIIAVALPFVGGCVNSLNPALTDSDAVEVPGLVGVWGVAGDSLEVRQVGQRPPSYLVANSGRILSPEREPDTIPPTWFDVRVGRLAGRMVVEGTPSVQSDTALKRITHTYDLVRLTYMVGVIEVRGDTLLMFEINDDSAYAVLARHQCDGPFVRFSMPRYLELTGTTGQVRSTYECLLRQPGILREDNAPMSRMRAH